MAYTTSDEVARFWPLLEYHARRFSGVGGAEFDDLVQEGAIAVWLTLEKGFIPSDVVIQRAMKDWIRHTSHRGLSHNEETPLPA